MKKANFQVLAQDQMNQIVGGGTANVTVIIGPANVNETRSVDTGDSGLDSDTEIGIG